VKAAFPIQVMDSNRDFLWIFGGHGRYSKTVKKPQQANTCGIYKFISFLVILLTYFMFFPALFAIQ